MEGAAARQMRVTLRYWDGCPNWQTARDRLRDVLREEGMADVEPADNQVILYEDINYGGQTMSFEYDKAIPDLTKWKLTNSKNTWNDRISSIKVGKNAKITLYGDINYKGDNIPLLGTGSGGVGNFPNLVSIGWNDKASSFKVSMGNLK